MSLTNDALLTDLVTEAKPGFACGQHSETGIFQIRMNNIQRDGSLDLIHRRRVPTTGRAIKNSLLALDDILFNTTNSPDLVGKTALIQELDEPTVFSNHFLRLRVDRQRVRPDYLARWLQWQFSLGRFRAMCRQWVNQATVSTDTLLKMRVPVSTLDEQRRIANTLDRVDKVRTKRRQTIALLDNLANSIFLDMFGAPREDWPLVTVSELASATKNSIRTGPFGSQLRHDEFVNAGIPVLGIDNAANNEFRWGQRRYITPEKYRKLSRYTVHPGDVLITIMGTCGRCAIVPDDISTAVNTKHLCCITLNQKVCLPEFLHGYFLTHPAAQSYLRRTAKGAIMSGLNMGIIKELPVHLAPIELQLQHRERLLKIRSLRSTHQTQLAEMDALFAAVQYRAFRGELFGDDSAGS